MEIETAEQQQQSQNESRSKNKNNIKNEKSSQQNSSDKNDKKEKKDDDKKRKRDNNKESNKERHKEKSKHRSKSRSRSQRKSKKEDDHKHSRRKKEDKDQEKKQKNEEEVQKSEKSKRKHDDKDTKESQKNLDKNSIRKKSKDEINNNITNEEATDQKVQINNSTEQKKQDALDLNQTTKKSIEKNEEDQKKKSKSKSQSRENKKKSKSRKQKKSRSRSKKRHHKSRSRHHRNKRRHGDKKRRSPSSSSSSQSSSSSSSSLSSEQSSSSSRSKHRRRRRSRERRRRRSSSSSYFYKRGTIRTPSPFATATGGQEPKKFWDGFQWVVKINSVANIDPALRNQTIKMRRVQLCNIPLELDFTEDDVKMAVQNFLISTHLNDNGNMQPVLSCQLNTQGNYAILEMSSVEEANRLIKIEKIKIMNTECKITRVGESTSGNSALSLQSLVNSAQTAAQAQAAAIQAVNLFQNKDPANKFQFSLQKTHLTQPQKYLKISNTIQPGAEISSDELDDIKEDVVQEASKYGQISNAFIINKHQVDIGAQLGTIFIEFEDIPSAQNAATNMAGRKFDALDLKIAYVNDEVYQQYFKPLQYRKA